MDLETPTVKLHHVAALAGNWLASGATSFSIWLDGQPLKCWPAKSHGLPPDLRAPVYVQNAHTYELRVSGVIDAESQRRLANEARLIAEIMDLEAQVTAITHELSESQNQLLALYNITQSTRGQLQINAMLQSLTREAAKLVKAPYAFTIVSTGIGRSITVQHPEDFLDPETFSAFLSRLRSASQEIVLNDSNADFELPDMIDNMCFVPIQIGGAVIAGGLGLLNKAAPGFTASNLKLIRTITAQAGALIEKSLLYQDNIDQIKFQTEMEVARRVQISLLPRHAPQVQGVSIFARTLPASQVGGDFYDFIAKPDHPLLFTLGDVTGKGLSAALLMTMTLSSIRSKATFMPDPFPEIIMSRANEDLYDDFTEVHMFVTVFIGHYDPHHRLISFANAGHSPVISCPAGGPATLLKADAPPMGVLPMSMCARQVLRLDPGDVLVIASDGFSEAANLKGEFFGHERLLQLIETYSTRSVETIAQMLFNSVRQFRAGMPQQDDQTLVVLKGEA